MVMGISTSRGKPTKIDSLQILLFRRQLKNSCFPGIGESSQTIVAASACLKSGLQIAQAFRVQKSPDLIEHDTLVSLTKVSLVPRPGACKTGL